MAVQNSIKVFWGGGGGGGRSNVTATPLSAIRYYLVNVLQGAMVWMLLFLLYFKDVYY